MAKLTVHGMAELIANLMKLKDKGKEMSKRALYEGAGVMADTIKSSIESIPTRPESSNPESDIMQSGITAAEKQSLLDGFGISHMREAGGGVNVRIGFGGRNANGKANSTVAAGVESGTSWTQATHFFSTAVNASTGAAEAAIENEIDDQIRQIMP